MSHKPERIYKLEKSTNHPIFEGFALEFASSLLDRGSLEDDITPGFDASEKLRKWEVPSLSGIWHPPKVIGRVASFNDFPCLNMTFPVFSKRACEELKDFLPLNGEILPLNTDVGQFYFYNITNVVDILDYENSICEFWCEPPTTAVDIDYFAFHEDKLAGLSIFRIYEEPLYILVTDQFVKKVHEARLSGFTFKQIWPLPKGTKWRTYNRLENKENDIKLLSNNTMVVSLIAEGTKISMRDKVRIEKLESELDALLMISDATAPYYGRYEGNDIVGNEYRMFISCPDANSLEIKLLPWLRKIDWTGTLNVIKRFGEMYDSHASEELVQIQKM